MKVETQYDIDINILQPAYLKMMSYAKAAGIQEISGLGFVNEKKEIYDVILLPQISSSALTELDIPAIHKYLTDHLDNKDIKVEDIKLWWHSHGNGTCYWSKTDKENILSLMDDFDLLYSIVVNNKRDYKARIDKRFENNILTFDGVDITTIDKNKTKIINEIRKKSSNPIGKLFANNLNIHKVTFEREKEEIDILVEFKENISEEYIAEIEAEVEKKNLTKEIAIINNIELDDLTGKSKVFKAWIFKDKSGYFLRTKKNNQTIRMTIKMVARRKKEILSEKNIHINNETAMTILNKLKWNKNESIQLAKVDIEGIAQFTRYPETLLLYYSKFKEFYEKLDKAKYNYNISNILIEFKLILSDIFDFMVNIEINKAALANEFLYIILDSCDIKEQAVWEFLDLLNLTSLEIDEDNNCISVGNNE